MDGVILWDFWILVLKTNQWCLQMSGGLIYFCDALWPEFSKYDFLKAIFHYQRGAKLQVASMTESVATYDDDQITYVEKLKYKYRCSLLEYCERTKYFSQEIDVKELYALDHETVYSRLKFARNIILW